MSYDLTSFEKAMTLFANRVGIIVNLEVGDKMTPEQAYPQPCLPALASWDWRDIPSC